MAAVPSVTLVNGLKIPILGLGTWRSNPEEVTSAVKTAIDLGYRHFDCALVYQNENEVGEALKAKIADGTVKREDLWITSKLWHTYHAPASVESGLRTTLKSLGLDYVDLYLIHGPLGFQEGGDLYPMNDAKDKLLYSDVDYVDTWKAMEEVHKKGLTKSIGLSNFNSQQVERVLKVATIPPVTNQVECHPYLNQKKLAAFCKERGIVLTAYSPLGSPGRPRANPSELQPIQDPAVHEIAKRHQKSPGQILLRYQTQLGNITIPKSVTPSRIRENLNIFDFELSECDMNKLNSLDRNGRVCVMNPLARDHPHFPYNIPF